jgi:phage gp46-like protein
MPALAIPPRVEKNAVIRTTGKVSVNVTASDVLNAVLVLQIKTDVAARRSRQKCCPQRVCV